MSRRPWIPALLLAWTHVLYGFALRLLPPRPLQPAGDAAAGELPAVSLVVAAHAEEAVIAEKVSNARALDYPSELLEVVVVVDGDVDRTAELARAAGADVVLELPRSGKVLAQDAGVAQSTGEIIAFSDANAAWQPAALRELVEPFRDPQVAYVCGRVRFTAGGDNQEGLYWRHEMHVRALESSRWSVTAGNGAIYAVRRADYLRLGPAASHDLAFPFSLVKRGRRAVEAEAAVAVEAMVPTIEGELARKRRMMQRAWPIVVQGGMLDPRGYPPAYALMIASHRALRYASPALHLWLFGATLAGARRDPLSRAALAGQLALLGSAALGGRAGRLGLVARYYTATTASIALGAYDWLREGSRPTWSAAEGTRP